VITHSINLHEARGNISFNSAYFMTSSLQEILPTQQQMPVEFPTKMVLTSELASELPHFFHDYAANESSVLKSNLCTLSLNNNLLYVGISCEQVLNGIMINGYPETVIFFNDIVNKYSFIQMSQFGGLTRSNASYPVFM
jgi:hypothetical protein